MDSKWYMYCQTLYELRAVNELRDCHAGYELRAVNELRNSI